MLPTDLEKAGTMLALELERAIAMGYALPAQVIAALSHLRMTQGRSQALQDKDLEHMYRTYMASRDKTSQLVGPGKPRLAIVKEEEKKD